MKPMKPPFEPICAEVDLSRVARNTRTLKSHAQNAQLMAVVKANAYGHGAEMVARTCLENGATWLGVARLSEALALREKGIDASILVLGHTPSEGVPLLVKHRIRQTVCGLDHARALGRAAEKEGAPLLCHIKLDTGMGRLGFDASSAEICAEMVHEACGISGLCAEGIFTHFATADEKELGFARIQLERFLESLEALKKKGRVFPLRHGANSASIFSLPELRLDMVRGGICLYGLSPSSHVRAKDRGLLPAMRVCAKVVQVKRLKKGESVSYGATWVAMGERVVATVACGYGDGYPRRLSNRGRMLVKGESAPVVGRVCMDMAMVDVTGISGVCVGDEVVVLGVMGDEEVSAEEIADLSGTINYEITCQVAARVPRVYG